MASRHSVHAARLSLFPALLLVAGACILASCAASAASEPPASMVVAVHVVRTSAFPSNHIPPFTAALSNAAQVQKLYAAMLQLPYYPSDVDMACPAQIGIYYDLTFTLSTRATFRAIFQSDSCPSVTLGKDDMRSAWYESFFQLFAQTVHLPMSQIVPKPQASGPSAPTPTSLP
jgi:hypothetical protein